MNNMKILIDTAHDIVDIVFGLGIKNVFVDVWYDDDTPLLSVSIDRGLPGEMLTDRAFLFDGTFPMELLRQEREKMFDRIAKEVPMDKREQFEEIRKRRKYA